MIDVEAMIRDAGAAGGVTGAIFDLIGGDPHRPRLVWYGSGRTELSGASLMNWSAKTAGLLVDELGARPGDTVLWRVHRSWQGLPLLLGCWWAGLVVSDDESLAGEAIAAFVDDDGESDAEEVIVASPHPFGLAVADLPPGLRSVADAVLPQADRFVPRVPGPAADSPAVITPAGVVTVRELIERVGASAAAVAGHGVVLSAAVPDLPDGVCAGPLAAWATGGTLVQLGADAGVAADPAALARVAADERATVTIGVDVEGVRRIG